MRLEFLDVLRCPQTGARLELHEAEYKNSQVCSGCLVAESGGNRYSIRDFIPRFGPESNYAESFGMQWNLFRQSQVDSYTGLPISKQGVFSVSQWPYKLDGQRILEAGSDAGRFTEVLLQTGAEAFSFD